MSPSGNSRKARFARFLAASDRESRFSSSQRLRSQADLSGRLSQNEVYPVRRLTDVPSNSRKARFARFLAASDRESRFSSSQRLRSQADLSGRLEPKRGLSGSEAYGCPLGTAAKRGLPGSWPPLTARLASRAVERLRSQADLSGRLSQNEVYPVRRLTDVPLEQPQSEVCPVLALL